MVKKKDGSLRKGRGERPKTSRPSFPGVEPRVGYAVETVEEARQVMAQFDLTAGWPPCQEASMFSRGVYLPCGAPGAAAVWHAKDRRVYVMCGPCTDHNVHNRGGVLVAKRAAVVEKAPVTKTGPPLVISTVSVLEVKALQVERRDLEGRLEKLKAQLKEREAPIIAALEAGVPCGPGCPPCAVDREERVTPRWKDEALTLAGKLGLNVGVYEAEIRAMTTPTVIKKLVINGRQEAHRG